MSTKKWTTNDIPDQEGKVIIVTGGNSGLGYESVKALAQKGANVILACRSEEKGRAAVEEIGEVAGTIDIMELDLMDFASITSFVEAFKAKYDRLDVLLNNAGIMTTPYFLTKDGLEAQMGTNHFGHFSLTGQLLDLILSTPEARVVNVSSTGHKMGSMDFDNLLFEEGKDYTPMKSYSRSKLANLLFTYELQRKFEQNGINALAVAAHPGGSKTNLGRHVEGKLWFKILGPLLFSFASEQDQGALPQIRASVDPQVQGSDYYGPNGFMEMAGDPVKVESNTASHNEADAKRLWDISEELTGITFPFSNAAVKK